MNVNTEEVCTLISNILECDVKEINEDTGILKHFMWDSLTHISIIVGIEEKFDVSIQDEMIGELKDIKSIINYLKSL